MGKSQHMAGVMNLRSLKFCFSQRLLSWEISGSFLPSCQLGISLAQLVSCEGLDCGLRSSRRPQGSELGTVCVGGGWGQGAEPRWRACYCLEVPFSILTCAWHLSPTVLIRGSWPSAFLLSAVPVTLAPCRPQRRNIVPEDFHIRRFRGGLVEIWSCALGLDAAENLQGHSYLWSHHSFIHWTLTKP